MQGTPDPVLGSDLATLLVAAAAGTVVAILPLHSALRERDSRRLALAGGAAYALLCLTAWAGVRFVADAFVESMVADPLTLVGFLALAAVVLGLQAAVPVYLHARYALLSPLVALFGLTTLVLYAFLRVRGESEPLVLYALFFGPVLIAGLLAVALAEVGVRRGLAVVAGDS